MQLPLGENESARIENLRTYRILDTLPEQSFDDITRLAAYVCGTPIALIGFMDLERLWFKSRIGWEVDEIPRDMSFCAYTILQSDVLVVPDTLKDEGRLCECPLATHGGMRFYAGVPLISAEGYSLGTLCAMDSIPRGLTAGQIDALRKLAHQAAKLLESYRTGFKPFLTGLAQPNNATEALEALRRSEKRLQGIISSAMDAIITIDSHQRIVVFNAAAEEIFRCTTAEALGQPIDRFIPGRFRAGHQQHVQAFAQTEVTARSMYSLHTLYALRADGEEFPMEATISQVETEGEKLFTVILRDVSARLRMESELRQAQKMEAVGQLAGGIAHEFNNFLGIILGYNELLFEEAVGNERLGRYTSEIRTATKHAASLTRQLLAFGRKQAAEPQVVDLNHAIWEGYKLLRRLLPSNIDVVPVLASTLGRIKIDPGQIQQILINLLVNARDAMPGGGKVVIETADADVNEATAGEPVGRQPGSYVMLSVSDNGCGMTDETRAHLFEPFYTTKEPGKGTGLGLSAVYGIVKQNGGYVAVESAVGKGTEFRLYLPRVQAAEEAVSVTPRGPVMQGGGRTILVVEDETALRRLLCMSLERNNYTVIAARDGSEALEIFRLRSEQIHLVVSDLMLPRMDGFEFKNQVTALKPDVKFLFMSAYAEQMVESGERSLQGCAFLQKPFLPVELVDKARELLAAAA